MATPTSAQRPVGGIDLASEQEPEEEKNEKQKELFVVGRGVKECTPWYATVSWDRFFSWSGEKNGVV
jgi:hypothetical protein